MKTGWMIAGLGVLALGGCSKPSGSGDEGSHGSKQAAASAAPSAASSSDEAPTASARRSPVGGNWFGQLGSEEQLWGQVDESGQAWLLTADQGLMWGKFEVTDAATGAFKASLKEYQEDHIAEPVATLELTGTVTPRKKLAGTATTTKTKGGKAETSKFSFEYDEQYEKHSDLKAIAGKWLDVRNDLTIDPSGKVEGTTTYGCKYSGTLKQVDPRFSAFEVTIQSAGCKLKGEFQGIFGLAREFVKNDNIHSVFVGKDFAHISTLARAGTKAGKEALEERKKNPTDAPD